MKILYDNQIVSFVPMKDVLLSEKAVHVLNDLFTMMKEAFGEQKWEETYWLQGNGNLIYKLKGEIDEAAEFCIIEPTHWSLRADIKQ